MRKKLLILAIPILATGQLLSAAPAEIHHLRIKPSGQAYQFTMVMDHDINLDMGAMGQQELDNHVIYEMTLQALPATEREGVDLTVTYDRLVMTSSMGDTSIMAFDSRTTGGDEELSRISAALLGNTVTLELNPRGEIVGGEGFDAILEALTLAIEAENNPVIATLQQSFDGDSAVQMMQSWTTVLPAGPISFGETWTHRLSQAMPMFGDMKILSTMTAGEVGDVAGEPCLLVDVVMEVSIDFDSSLFDQMLSETGGSMEMDIEDTTGVGTSCISLANGLTLSNELTMPLNIQVTMNLGEEIEGRPFSGEQEISMQMLQVMTTRVVE